MTFLLMGARHSSGAQTHKRHWSGALLRTYFPLAFSMARQTFCAVAGISTSLTPSGANASITAFITAGIAPTVPASPAPLAPSGLYLVGTGFDFTSMLHIVSARGMA